DRDHPVHHLLPHHRGLRGQAARSRQHPRRVHARPLGVARHRLRARLHRADHGGAVVPGAVPRLGQDARLRAGAGCAVVLRRPAAAPAEGHGRGQAGERPRRPALTASPPGGTRAWRRPRLSGRLAVVRFVFSPPAQEAAGLLTLPWSQPLEDWDDERLVEIRQRGISRHVVRFIADDGGLYALKSIPERLARREYRLLRALAESGVPAVEVVGVAVDLGPDADAILVTKFLTYATTYRAVFSSPRGAGPPADKLLDALVELLVRLHLSGFFWGDCSLSNTLFRYDAGALKAYFLDAETSEQHAELSDGLRRYDVELAVERIFGELLDLQAGDLLPADLDPLEVAEGL